MKIKVLGVFGSEGQGQRPSAFLVNDHVLVDAGSVPGALNVEEQREIEHALLSHAHLDHIAGLAYLTDTLAITAARGPVLATSIAPVVDDLRTHAFNDHLWPDFSTIPTPKTAILRYRTLADEVESRVAELWVTPIRVDHTVEAVGFLIHDGETGFLYSGDTGPTERIWQAARGLKGLKAVIVETAFPNRLDGLAQASKHLTPAMLSREMKKMPSDLPLWIYHIKPHFFEETTEELQKIDPARIHILEQGKTYTL
ncbi:MAG: 3',5'-cyclic-nucleotide phosphodiesterase [Candidatus Rokubacteria bacterium]|nr:3',5'-cyclic-nucleotide phosphodiesterase [Candidatus Rokubacteria bacterium]